MNNAITRRWFIGGMAASLGTAASSRLFAAPGAANKPGAKLKIGVLSDVHLKDPGDGRGENRLVRFRCCGTSAQGAIPFRGPSRRVLWAQGPRHPRRPGDIITKGYTSHLRMLFECSVRVVECAHGIML